MEVVEKPASPLKWRLVWGGVLVGGLAFWAGIVVLVAVTVGLLH